MAKKILLRLFGLVAMVIIPVSALADDKKVKTEFGEVNFSEYVNKVYNYALVLGTGLAIVMVLWGGINLIWGGGNPETQKTAKDTIMYAVLGLLLLYIVWIFLKFIGV